ncbi:MAG: nicotinate (nicotinamide) nucleotide adenylyltransferase [Spirochaetales bacterium]|jgi:nicotinate-nucleotide adenylyltransferase|nr:nicotinate (nicotinamide) nucleotide adenylyltransferase [Spirochaetales bacterium]
MKIAVLGGTFNPIHNGHLFLAEEVLSLGYERVIFVPSHKPAHKEVNAHDDPLMRLEMTRLACAGREEFIVEDCEILRKGTSYTIQTIEYLMGKYDIAEKPGLVIGDDLVAGFDRWKNSDALRKTVRVIIAHRTTEARLPFSGDHVYVQNAILPLSSSEIRRRIQEGRAYRYLIPEAVYAFIRSRGLYTRLA